MAKWGRVAPRSLRCGPQTTRAFGRDDSGWQVATYYFLGWGGGRRLSMVLRRSFISWTSCSR